jgi:hypothetical protein
MIPTLLPVIFWGETLWISFAFNLFRIGFTWYYINLLAITGHKVGTKPFDATSTARDSFWVNLFFLGEGFSKFFLERSVLFILNFCPQVITTIITRSHWTTREPTAGASRT